MDRLCRLCLTSHVEMACKLAEEKQLLHKLSSLCIQIEINDFLPSCICSSCCRTIEDFYKFIETVSQNETKLLYHLKEGNLDIFYQSLINKNQKDEIKSEENVESCSNEDFETRDDVELNNSKSVNGYIYSSQLKTENICEIGKTKVKKSKRSKLQDNSKKINNYIGKEHDLSSPKEKPSNVDLEKENKTESIELESTKINFIHEDHKCLTCLKNLRCHAELIMHYKTEHSTHSIIINEKLDKPDTLFDVKNVDKSLNTDSTIVKHENMQKSDRPYCCKICGRTFPSVNAIIRHGRAHSTQNMYCSYRCGYSTVYSGALRDHEKRHEKNYKYKCGTCGAGFHVKTWHDQHQNIHNNIKPFVCEVCGMAFHMDRYLSSHRSTVHPGAIEGVSRYSCQHCERTFSTMHAFRVHLEQHSGKRSYLCEQCGKNCSSSEQLRRHSATHAGLKPYCCSICNKRFARQFNVTVHERSHAGQKHLCRHCGKYFAQRSTLLRHYRKRHPDVSVEKRSLTSNANT